MTYEQAHKEVITDTTTYREAITKAQTLVENKEITLGQYYALTHSAQNAYPSIN